MPTKQLVRSKADRQIAGVAGGVAAYFGIESHVVRLLWVLAVLIGGFGFLAYVVLWIALPEGDADGTAVHSRSAISIAEERYARGEITAEELTKMRAHLR